MIRENSHQIIQFSLIIHNEVFDEQAPQVDIFSFSLFCLTFCRSITLQGEGRKDEKGKTKKQERFLFTPGTSLIKS